MIKNELAEYINKYIELSNKTHEIIKFLFEHTELFEEKYIDDFHENLFRFFAGKITRNGREINQIKEMLSEEDKLQLQKMKLRRL